MENTQHNEIVSKMDAVQESLNLNNNILLTFGVIVLEVGICYLFYKAIDNFISF